jgi:folylpolyglutamate synthase/dihydropteroate synthase
MLIAINKSFDDIHLTEIKYERSSTIKDLKNICDNKGITATEEPDAVGYINKFLKGNKENCLVVLGSMYLLGDVKKSLIL